MATGDDLVLGNGNSAQTPTVILASIDNDGFSDFELGRAIFEAGPTAPPNVPDDPFMGVLGRGANGCKPTDPPGHAPGMPGVAGYGGTPGGVENDAQGGCGVMGIGGSTPDHDGSPYTYKWGPGPGLYAMGGNQQLTGEFPPRGNGAGVIGDSGISNILQPVPDLPSFADTVDVGVYGRSRHGAGVAGTSIGDRGGVFSSGQINGPSVSQMRLVPSPGSFGVSIAPLPKNGQPGDFFVRMNTLTDLPFAELWFCLGVASNNPTDPGVRWGLVAFSTTQTA